MRKLTIVLAVMLMTFGSVAGAASIGINMGSNETSLASGDVAGVTVAQGNWNNAVNNSGSLSNMKDDSGTATTADASWSATTTWRVVANGTATADAKLMYGYIDPIYPGNTAVVNLTQIPYATYDIYVYFGSNNTGATATVTDGTTTYSFTNGANNPGGNGFQAADYVRTTDTGTGYPLANYAKFEGRTGTSKTITVLDVSNGSGIFAVQIVDVAPSLPGAASSPSPVNGATNVAVTTDLSWTAGSGATSHNVYFGTTSPGTSRGNQTATTYDTGTMTNSTVYYWRIDEVNTVGTTTGTVWSFTTAAPVYKATNPSPSNGATSVANTADLSWTAGALAASHDVYFGTSQAAVAAASRLDGDIDGSGEVDIEDITALAEQWLGAPTSCADLDGDDEVSMVDFAIVSADWLGSADAVYKGNQAGTSFDPGTLAGSTTYYWRIDEVNCAESASPWSGDVWSFTTASLMPGQAGSPSPANGAGGVGVDTNLSWTAGSGATSHNVYFGTASPGAYQGNQTATTYEPGTMVDAITYYWRIDEVNAYGTTTGTVWSFTASAGISLVISNVSPSSYTVQYDSLAVDQFVYIDRAYTFTDVASLEGFTYIKTANDDKMSSGDSFLTFYVNQNIIVYIGHDNGISPKPSWMSSFIDSGEDLGTTDKTLSLYYKEFSAGTVVLGGNGGSSDAYSMYSVVIVPAPTTPPTQASNPTPADSATDVSVNTGLSWTAGIGAFSRDVYFGTSNPPAFQDTQTTKTYNPGTLAELTTYYWRIDERNSIGTTTGTVWSFTTGQAPSPGAIVFPGYGTDWLIKTPAELGCDGSKLDQLASNIGGNGIIVRQGYVIKTWGSQTAKSDWASAAKPVTTTLLFFAIEEELLDSVHELIQDHGWDLITKDEPMEFYHLANMTGGYTRGEAPGAAWAYNDYGITLYVKTLFDNVYGTTPNTAATNANRLGALGFQDGSIYGSRNGYGVETSTRDFARIGWFWCNKGYWDGQQLLPKWYFDEYMKALVPSSTPRTTINGTDYLGIGTYGGGSDQTQYGPGVYGCNWWCNPNQSNWPDAPADTVQANGHWGIEVMTVIPSLSVVVATYGGNMGDHATGSSSSTMNQNLKLLTEACPPPVATGFIIVDPSHPSRMVYSNTYEMGHPKPVCFSGSGDPEDFFWNNTTNNLNLLTGRGARCTYITAVLQDFGGPFNPGTGAALDAKLTEWEGYITQLENAGIITVFFFFDDAQPLTSNWEELVDKCVAKFKHHRLLIWSVAEEYGEALTTAQVSAVAARIKAQDDNDHVVGVHQNHGNTFNFMSDSNIDMFLMQLNYTSPSDLHNAVKNSNANGTKILNMAEAADHASQTRTNVRLWNWASMMGGASAVQVLYMGRASDPADYNTQEKYDDCGRLTDFMESTNLNVTTSRDDLARGNTDYVLANPGAVYIAYGDSGTSLGLNIVGGTYRVKWFDPIDGDWANLGIQTLSAGDQVFTKPAAIGSEAALSLELGVDPADILANEDCATRDGVNRNHYNNELGLLVKGAGDFSWIEFALGSIPVTQATLVIYQHDGGLTASWDITVRGAEYSFDETTFTGTDVSSWTVIGIIPNVWVFGQTCYLDITDFYNDNLGKTVTLQLKCDNIPDLSNGPVFEDHEGTRTGNGATYGPKISIQ